MTPEQVNRIVVLAKQEARLAISHILSDLVRQTYWEGLERVYPREWHDVIDNLRKAMGLTEKGNFTGEGWPLEAHTGTIQLSKELEGWCLPADQEQKAHDLFADINLPERKIWFTVLSSLTLSKEEIEKLTLPSSVEAYLIAISSS